MSEPTTDPEIPEEVIEAFIRNRVLLHHACAADAETHRALLKATEAAGMRDQRFCDWIQWLVSDARARFEEER